MIPGLTLIEPTNISYSHIKKRHTVPFESNYVGTVAAHSRSRKRFNITWRDPNCLSLVQLTSLETYFNSTQGSSFTFTHPWRGTTFTVVFGIDEISTNEIIPGQYYEATIILEEV